MIDHINPKDHKHWTGTKNKVIRYWFYNQRGLDLFNSFKYIAVSIFALYYTLKLTNPWWLLGMFTISLPCLSIIGYIQVHHVGKVIDYLNVKFSSHYSIYQIELLEQQLKSIEEIRDALVGTKPDRRS